MGKKKQILIVEDEPIIADDLAMCVDQLGHEVVEICSYSEEVLKVLDECPIDLMLLDIKIKGDMDGIQLAHQVKEKKDVPFIFISSLYDKTTVSRAKNTFPAGYVVKPFKDQDIQVAIDMALNKTGISPVSKITTDELNLFIRKSGSIVPLDFNEVLYIEASDNYSIFHMDSEKHIVAQTLKVIEEKLIPQGYCRIHKTFLINLRRVDRIEHSVVFINGAPLPIGKVFKKPFLDRLTVF